MSLDKRTYEVAVVLKALELRSTSGPKFEKIENRLLKNKREIKREYNLLKGITESIDSKFADSVEQKEIKINKNEGREITELSWDETLEEAKKELEIEGIDPKKISINHNSIQKDDLIWALLFGVLGAIVPSIGGRHKSPTKLFDNIEAAADKGSLPNLIQNIFGEGSPASFLDNAGGPYHRYKDPHDLFLALKEGVSMGLPVNKFIEIFQHLLRDSFGITGIPMPGSKYFGDMFATWLGNNEITDIINISNYSRYASFRMTDALSTGTTGLLNFMYRKYHKIERNDSRFVVFSTISYGVNFLTTISVFLVPGLRSKFPERSRINYATLTAIIYNVIKLHSINKDLQQINSDLSKKIDEALRELNGLSETNPAKLERNLIDFSKIEVK